MKQLMFVEVLLQIKHIFWFDCYCTCCVSGLGVKSVKTVVGGGAPGSVVQGARTAVMMGNPDPRGPGAILTSNPDPGHGIDLDRVAADLARDSSSLSQAGGQPGGPRQIGRSIAGVLSSTAQNIKSKFANMGAVTAPLVARSSPSPRDMTRVKVREVPIRVEQSGGGASVSPHVIPLTVPGAEYGK